MQMSLVQLAVALVSVLMQSAVMVLMVRRKLRAAYPFFYTFLALNTISVAIGMVVFSYAPNQYAAVYWTGSTIVMLLGFGVLYEVFVNLLKPYSALIDLGKMLFVWAAVFLLLAGFLTALVTSGPKSSRLMMACELIDRCVHLMQCGMLLLLVLFEKRLNLSWRNSGMCVAAGVGLRAALDLSVAYGVEKLPGLRPQFSVLYGATFIAILVFLPPSGHGCGSGDKHEFAQPHHPPALERSPGRLQIRRPGICLQPHRLLPSWSGADGGACPGPQSGPVALLHAKNSGRTIVRPVLF
jgi:hypothetical protein